MPELGMPLTRQVYARLLRLYPKAYRERFGEGMEQVFVDLSRERAQDGGSMLAFLLWACADTCVGIVREHLSSDSFLFMTKTILRPLLITLAVLVIPLIGAQTVDGWNWTGFDFLGAGTILFVTALAFELIAKRISGNVPYRIATALWIVASFLILWINLAVGIIGNEDNPANLLYFGVVFTGIATAFVARLQPEAMSRAMVATAVALAIIPMLVLTAGQPEAAVSESPGLVRFLMLNAGLLAFFVTSAALFRKAATTK